MATLAELIANVVKIRGFIGVYLDVPTLSPKQKAALKTNLVQLDRNLAALAAYEPPVEAIAAAILAAPPVRDHVLTYDEEHELYLDAADVLLETMGLPHGREGAERGALSLWKNIEIAESLDLPLHVAEWKAQIVPGASQ